MGGREKVEGAAACVYVRGVMLTTAFVGVGFIPAPTWCSSVSSDESWHVSEPQLSRLFLGFTTSPVRIVLRFA